ncbi:MAG: Fe-S cluster assembly protein SufD [Firmicutes bacterium]|nr:Fe-S cluster assembly protein SufD [Bacillota bacterium]
MKVTQALNTLPRLTYRWLKLNNYHLPERVHFPIKPYRRLYMPPSPDRDLIFKAMDRGEIPEYSLSNPDFGVSQELVSLGKEFFNAGFQLEVPPGKRICQPVYIQYKFTEEDNTVIDYNLIKAGKNSTITILIEYWQDDQARVYHNGVTQVLAEEGAEVTVIKVQRLAAQAVHFDSQLVTAGPSAAVNYRQVELGSRYALTNYLGLLAEKSKAEVDVVYLGDGRRVLDLSYQMVHQGYRSKSNILVRGALRDLSRKVFRGTLDFKKGAAHSAGREEEAVILLDPTVKADAIPLLLSEEDDVQGDHAASAGKVHPEHLFYLMSRGLSEQEAAKTIVEASFQPILRKIPIVREKIEKEIERRLVCGEGKTKISPRSIPHP